MLLACWGAPSPRVAKGQLGGDHLAHRRMGRSSVWGLGGGRKLQLSCVHYLNHRDFDGDDDAAGGDGGLRGQTNDGVALISGTPN